MIEASDFLAPAVKRGFSFWTGVPCSLLAPFINSVIRSPDLDYLGAASEGEAVGVAAGAYLAGRRTVVICQNSGLGNAVNPLTSLSYPFRIPTLLVVTHRGEPGLGDAPQHELMGRICCDLLDTIGVPWEVFPERKDKIDAYLDRAEQAMESTGLPYALVMKKGSVASCEAPKHPPRLVSKRARVQGSFSAEPGSWMPRREAVDMVRRLLGDDAAIIATTGKAGRELFTLGHRPNQVYMVGSMGCAPAIALGLCEAGGSDRKVVVLDGDGAALMKMGVLATIGYRGPRALVHVLLDNEAHESTGGQATVSPVVDFARVASACGYRSCLRADGPGDLEAALGVAGRHQGPILVHVKVAMGSDPKLGRPTLTPAENRQQFMKWWSSR